MDGVRVWCRLPASVGAAHLGTAERDESNGFLWKREREREPKGRDNDLQTIRRSSKVVLADVIVPEQMGQEQRERANDPCYSLCLDPFQSPGGLILFWGRSLLTLFAVCGFAPVALSLRNQLRPGVFHEGDGARPLATPVRLPVLLIICYSFCPPNRELTITNNPPKWTPWPSFHARRDKGKQKGLGDA